MSWQCVDTSLERRLQTRAAPEFEAVPCTKYNLLHHFDELDIQVGLSLFLAIGFNQYFLHLTILAFS